MKIIEMSTIQVRILAQDTIPYHLLLRPDRVKLLMDNFAFQNHEIPFPLSEQQTPKILNLLSGEIKLNGKNIIITRILFENRKVQIKVLGSTNELNQTLLTIFTFLEGILDGFKYDDSKVILTTDQTECVVHLDVDFMSVFSHKFRKFLKTNIPPKMSNKVEMMTPRHLSFELSFEQAMQYRKYNINITSKNFTIEPRTTTSLDDKVFYTIAPCPSDVHIELIKEFEEVFKD